jgi:hypothetical protein
MFASTGFSAEHRTAYFGPLGLSRDSSARLNFIAQDPVQVELLFLDSTGATVGDSGPVSLKAGQSTSLTLAGTSLKYAIGALRAQVEARIVLLSHPDHPLAFASLELVDPGTTVLVLYPVSPVRALSTTMLVLGPVTLTGDVSAGITVANVSPAQFPISPIKATLSFFSADNTLLKQEQVTIGPGQTASLSMSDIAFIGPVTGSVKFDSTTALTTSSLQVFKVSTGTTTVALYPQNPIFPQSPVFPSNPIAPAR